MDLSILLQIIIGICFIGIVIVLFLESQDYLTYSIIFVMIIGLSTYFLRGMSSSELEGIVLAIDWDVIIFLICLFSIVEILNSQQVFQQIAIKIVNRFVLHPRRFFYAICITSTMIATVIEDLSVAIIFIPIVIQACRGIRISPVPYMFGITICINLASTLTPFGSAENIIIANHFNLSLHWHLINLGIYFIIALFITLFLLDRFLLTFYLKRYYYDLYTAIPGYFNPNLITFQENPKGIIPESYKGMNNLKDKLKPPLQKNQHSHHLRDEFLKNARLKEIKERVFRSIEQAQAESVRNGNDMISITVTEIQLKNIIEHRKKIPKIDVLTLKINQASFKRNLIGLLIFTGILILISKIVIAGLLGLILFVFINPIQTSSGKKIPSVSYYFKKIDAKLIYFFSILFITVYFMDLAGITYWIDVLVENWGHHDVFLISIAILVITSLLSGFLDDAPITIMFLPIIDNLLLMYNHPGNPIFIAFTLGINLGGNFLPQGAACDMMTLELAKKNKVEGFTYQSLMVIGGLFALLHVLLGIGYIYLYLLITL
ncbi:SLC13 family permease [Candidatus Harpocratesius sp.]